MHATILNITFDCADAKSQAMFWAAVTYQRPSRTGSTWTCFTQATTSGQNWPDWSTSAPR